MDTVNYKQLNANGLIFVDAGMVTFARVSQ